MKKCFLGLLTCLLCVCAYGQRNGLYYLDKQYEEDPYDELTYFYSGGNYRSNNVYLGRKDSVKLPYISPFIGYQLHNGLYAKATASYALTKTGHFDLLALEAGYDRNLGRHILTGIWVEKYFYQRNSPSVKAAIKESGTIYCQYKNKKVEPTISITINHNNSTDFVVGAGLGHNFRFISNTLNLIPAITFYAGSQHYYDEYFINRALKQDKSIPISAAVQNAGAYKPLDVELSAKTTFRANTWFFTVTPTYCVPLSPATIILPYRTVQEHLKSSLYIEIDACHRHERK